MAGTGARARKRVAAAVRAAAAPAAPAAAEAPPADEPVAVEDASTAVAAAAAAAEAAAAVVAESEAGGDGERLTGSLVRHTRPQLDAEATRLGIAIDPKWNKAGVAEAIAAHYEANPPGEPRGRGRVGADDD